MSEILVNTIKKADGTGSITVPAETGTVVTTATSGTQVLVSSDTTGATTSALEIDLPTSSTYAYYTLVVNDIYFSASGNDLVAQLAVDGTYATGAGNYGWAGPVARTGVDVNRLADDGHSNLRFGWYSSGNSSSEPSQLELKIYNSNREKCTQVMSTLIGFEDSGNIQTCLVGGVRNQATEIHNKIKLFGHSDGDLTYSRYFLYGVLA